MTLRLSVVGDHGSRLGTASTKVFGVHGGSIGRNSDNEWILPDPERYLSGKHARVDFRAGSYVLVDTSSNGTYINGAKVPLGKYHDYALKDGDRVRVGEYDLLVSIDKGNDFPPDRSAIVAYDGHAPSSAVKKSTAGDLGSELDLSELLDSSGLEPVGMGVESATAPASPEDEDQAGTPWHMMTRPLKMEPPTPTRTHAPQGPAAGATATATATAPQTSSYEADLHAFCRGAGIDPRTLSADSRGAALQLAGQLLRESIIGLMDLNQSRSEFRARFGIATVSDDGPESPLNLARGVDEALVRLLSTSSKRSGSVDAIRHTFRELKAQNTATHIAMRAAFEDFLHRVDPKELEERFERTNKRGVFGNPNKGKYWDLYAELFAGLVQRPADGFPHSFTESFAKAFEAKLRKLVPPRRSVFAAYRNDAKPADDKAVGDS